MNSACSEDFSPGSSVDCDDVMGDLTISGTKGTVYVFGYEVRALIEVPHALKDVSGQD